MIDDHRLSHMLSGLNDAVHWSKRYRNAFIVPFVLIFVAGLWYSIGRLNVDFASLAIAPALLLCCVIAPLGVLYGALGLKLLAQISGSSISVNEAWRQEGYAQLADALPLPGGPLVRTSALMKSGVTISKSVMMVTAAGVMWIAIASIGAGVALLPQAPLPAYMLLATGMIAFLPIIGWIFFQAGILVTAMLLLHRLMGLALVSVRMLLSFAIIGQMISGEQAALFSFANISGSAVVVAPAGLGISEAIGSGLAALVNVDPAAAFLAMGLGRVVGLVSSCLVVIMTRWIDRPHQHLPAGEHVL
jgi:hypothetical protein